jgi:hypothetical protein
MSEFFNRTLSGVSIDEGIGQHEAGHFIRQARCIHRAHPAALTETDDIDDTTEVIDDSIDFGQVFIDIEIFHRLCRTLTVGHQHMLQANNLQSFNQALSEGVVGDVGAMTSLGGIDQYRYLRELAIRR